MLNTMMAAVMSAISLVTGPHVKVDQAEALCLAQNIYHEARGVSVTEQMMVADTTIYSAFIYKRSICEEVYAPARYSWTLSPIKRSGALTEPHALAAAAELAVLKLSGLIPVKYRITHFHERRIKDPWKGMQQVAMTKTFVWYKEK